MSRIAAKFAEQKSRNARLLIPYLTCGDPSAAASVEFLHALEAGGADLIELGVPFSDPIADGPVIQAASQRALDAGMTLPGVLDVLREFRKTSELPILLFTYLNPVIRYGFPRFAKDAVDSGADGLLLTDLAVEEAGEYIPTAHNAGLDTVFLASQTTSEERLARVCASCSGFVYLVSRAGVTGVRDTVSDTALPLVERTRELTNLPLALGFGLSTREHMAAIAPHADGGVVGSAIMKVVAQHGAASAEPLRALAEDLKAGLRLG